MVCISQLCFVQASKTSINKLNNKLWITVGRREFIARGYLDAYHEFLKYTFQYCQQNEQGPSTTVQSSSDNNLLSVSVRLSSVLIWFELMYTRRLSKIYTCQDERKYCNQIKNVPWVQYGVISLDMIPNLLSISHARIWTRGQFFRRIIHDHNVQC